MNIDVNTWLSQSVEIESNDEGWITLRPKEADDEYLAIRNEINIFIPDNRGERYDSIEKLTELIAACQIQIERLKEMDDNSDRLDRIHKEAANADD